MGVEGRVGGRGSKGDKTEHPVCRSKLRGGLCGFVHGIRGGKFWWETSHGVKKKCGKLILPKKIGGELIESRITGWKRNL